MCWWRFRGTAIGVIALVLLASSAYFTVIYGGGFAPDDVWDTWGLMYHFFLVTLLAVRLLWLDIASKPRRPK